MKKRLFAYLIIIIAFFATLLSVCFPVFDYKTVVLATNIGNISNLTVSIRGESNNIEGSETTYYFLKENYTEYYARYKNQIFIDERILDNNFRFFQKDNQDYFYRVNIALNNKGSYKDTAFIRAENCFSRLYDFESHVERGYVYYPFEDDSLSFSYEKVRLQCNSGYLVYKDFKDLKKFYSISNKDAVKEITDEHILLKIYYMDKFLEDSYYEIFQEDGTLYGKVLNV